MAFSIHETSADTPSLVTVSEVTTRHLRRLASSATDFIGKRVNAAVITIPTDFTDAQRDALAKAAKDAGIEVLQFINEPVAAALTYDARPEAKTADKIIVVADLGGTRSDVAVIASRGGIYTILATAHDYTLGGAQLDQVLVDYFAKEFLKAHKVDPRENAKSLAKLKLEAEATKKALSLGTSATIGIESLAEGIDFTSNINRTRYELLAGKTLNAFTRLIEEAVNKADLDLLDVDQVSSSSHSKRKMLTITRSSSPAVVLTHPRSLVCSSPSSLKPRRCMRPPLLPMRSTRRSSPSAVQRFRRV